MKKSFTILFLLMSLLPMTAQTTFPDVSDGTTEHWYYIQMQNGMGVLTVQGENQNIVTAEAVQKKADMQQWKVVPATDNRYQFVSRGGQIMFYNGDRFKSSAAPASGYSAFQIVQTSHGTYKGYEIYVDQLGSSSAYLNQWGGAGYGRELGCWTKGDPNNPLAFVAASDMAFLDVVPDAVGEVGIQGTTTWVPSHKHTLWYTTPGTTWMSQALPIGNGQFGATVLGGVHRDEIQFNDKTLWRGHVGSIVGNGEYGSYLNFGQLYITTTDAAPATDYRRYLDLEEGCAGVEYTSDGTTFRREYIASFPDDVVAIRYQASAKGRINTHIILFNANGTKPAYTIEDGKGKAVFQGTVARTGTSEPESFYCEARVVTSGGTVTATDEGIQVTEADELYVYLRGATNFSPDNDDYLYPAAELPSRVTATVKSAQAKGYEAIRNDHVADYQALEKRCQLSLTDAENTLPTPRLIAAYKGNPSQNLLLEELYFTYGRYLLISSSRGVTLPANLQGIWNNSNSPAWNSDIHSNINVQMNYWPAEVTNLSELHTAYTDYIYREACVRPQWRKNAQQIAGQTKGWTLTTENNIYGSGSNWMQNYTIANAWYCMHLWQHYLFTLDRDYLRSKALPAMVSCCEYWLERLVLAKDGTYECPNEYSPEHGPGSENATAHSQQLVWDLFNSTLKAIDVLGKDCVEPAFLNDLNGKMEKLDKGIATEVVNGKTLLREWKYTSQSKVSSYNFHRHLSHLMGLYPGSQIAEDIDKQIYEAAKNSLNTRGYAGTGWSLGWKVNLHARCHDGERCESLIEKALSLTTVTYNDGSERGGIYENLWDAHPPFQIDGNFGVTSGMAEMLLQSHQGKLELLPALPASTWKKGEVKGLRAAGAYTVDIAWEDGKATAVSITSDISQPAVIKYKDASCCFDVTDADGNALSFEMLGDNEIRLEMKAGTTYTFTHNGKSNIMQCDNIEEGDYYISIPDATPMYLAQLSSRSGHVGLTDNKEETGTIWTVTPYPATSPLNTYSNNNVFITTGTVYHLNNIEYNYGLRNLFVRTLNVNAQSLHPIFKHQRTGLLAIRASNVDSSQSNYDSWYGMDNGTLSAKLEDISCCWMLTPAETNGITTHAARHADTPAQYFSISGMQMTSDLKSGIYIRVQKQTDGTVRKEKVVVK